MITVELSWICDCISVYLKLFTHKAAMSPKKTSIQELKWKMHCFNFKTENRNIKRLVKGKNLVL